MTLMGVDSRRIYLITSALGGGLAEADEDGSGALDEEEFVNAFRNVKGMKGYRTEEQLCHLFMKIDANSDGTVDWDEEEPRWREGPELFEPGTPSSDSIARCDKD